MFSVEKFLLTPAEKLVKPRGDIYFCLLCASGRFPCAHTFFHFLPLSTCNPIFPFYIYLRSSCCEIYNDVAEAKGRKSMDSGVKVVCSCFPANWSVVGWTCLTAFPQRPGGRLFECNVGGRAGGRAADANAQQLDPPPANQFGWKQTRLQLCHGAKLLFRLPPPWTREGFLISRSLRAELSKKGENLFLFEHQNGRLQFFSSKNVKGCVRAQKGVALRRSKKLWRVKRVYHKNYIKRWGRPSAVWCRRESHPLWNGWNFFCANRAGTAEVPVQAQQQRLCMWVTWI